MEPIKPAVIVQKAVDVLFENWLNIAKIVSVSFVLIILIGLLRLNTSFPLIALFTVILQLILYAYSILANIALIHQMNMTVQGTIPAIKDSFSEAIRCLWSYVGLYVLAFIICIPLGLLFQLVGSLGIPLFVLQIAIGLVFFGLTFFTISIILFETTNVFGAVKRNFKLFKVSGSLTIFVIAFTLIAIAQLIFAMLGTNIAFQILHAILFLFFEALAVSCYQKAKTL